MNRLDERDGSNGDRGPPPSKRYRLKKLVERNQVAVLTSGTMVLMLLVDTTAVRATRAETMAHAKEVNAVDARDRAAKAEELAKARLLELT